MDDMNGVTLSNCEGFGIFRDKAVFNWLSALAHLAPKRCAATYLSLPHHHSERLKRNATSLFVECSTLRDPTIVASLWSSDQSDQRSNAACGLPVGTLCLPEFPTRRSLKAGEFGSCSS
jgi:hypothetical protein